MVMILPIISTGQIDVRQVQNGAAAVANKVAVGGGHGVEPKWSVRASLANLNRDAYLKIGTAIRKILDSYHEAYVAATKK